MLRRVDVNPGGGGEVLVSVSARMSLMISGYAGCIPGTDVVILSATDLATEKSRVSTERPPPAPVIFRL